MNNSCTCGSSPPASPSMAKPKRASTPTTSTESQDRSSAPYFFPPSAQRLKGNIAYFENEQTPTLESRPPCPVSQPRSTHLNASLLGPRWRRLAPAHDRTASVPLPGTQHVTSAPPERCRWEYKYLPSHHQRGLERRSRRLQEKDG